MKKFVIYTLPHCPYCDMAKNLLAANDYEWKEKDISHDKALVNEMLSKSNGRKTVPQIFMDDKHVGGFDDLQFLYNSGNL